ncbi:hypothetical protein Tco_0535551 [Tanacetum coccineum]
MSISKSRVKSIHARIEGMTPFFFGNKDEDAHDHIDRVLSIVDRLALRTIHTWDLLKKAFIQRYFPPSMTAKQLEDIQRTSSKKETNHYTRPGSAKYGKSQTSALVWDNRYAEWCDVCPSSEVSSQESNKPRPRDYTFREWTLIKGKKGHILDKIWEYCNQVHNKIYEWHNYEFENEECEEIGIEDKDYHPPEVQVETFEVKKYLFKGGQSFICVTKDLDNILPLGRKTGSKFKEMIRKEVENNKT